jgi:glutaminase
MLARTRLDVPRNCAPPPASPILALLHQIHDAIGTDDQGRLATYIPELATADRDRFGIALATADGHLYEVGDADQPFTIQSVAKPFVYRLAREDHGPEHLLSTVGVEPSGDAFNSIIFDERSNRPLNPVVNAGAIATTALIKGDGYAVRLDDILAMLGRFAGRRLEVDEAVHRSEQVTGHRNRAIAYLALNAGMIDGRVDEHLDLYVAQCSVLVTARDLAVMAATLAGGGVNPLTGERALAQGHVASVLAVMLSCGMYDHAGEWGYRVGIPAKSGVAGGIIAVLPGLLGIGTYSPLLDEHGNSRRGVRACDALAARLNLHPLRADPVSQVVFRRRYRGDTTRSKRRRNRHEQAVLAGEAAGICVYELQGALSFGTMEQVLRRLSITLRERIALTKTHLGSRARCRGSGTAT